MTEPILYQGGGFVLTQSVLRTPYKTYALDNIEFVAVQRSILLFVSLPAVGGILFVLRFFRYLAFFSEVMPLMCLCAGALYAAAQVGTLKVRSFALNDGEESNSFGLMTHLSQVRSAVERAIMARKGGEAA